MKYLKFEEVHEVKRKTKLWKVLSAQSGQHLAYISFYPSWRKYVASFGDGVAFDSKCLNELSKFLDEQNELRKVPRNGA
jgi:hypothetical protein